MVVSHLSVSLSGELLNQIREFAKEKDITISSIVRRGAKNLMKKEGDSNVAC